MITVATLNKIAPDVARIQVKDGIDANTVLTELHAFLDRAYFDGFRKVVFDMTHIEFPSASFIAFMIGKTMDFRRKKGDIQIINMSETARNHFAMFTPLTFLSFGKDDQKGITFEDDHAWIQESETKDNYIQVPAKVEDVNRITDFISDKLEETKLPRVERSKLKIAVYEACLNVIEHGYGFEPGHFINVEVETEDGQVKIMITDHGNSFDFYSVKPYDVNSAFEEERKNGYGLYIIKRSVDDIEYTADPIRGNTLTLIKNIN